MKDTIQKLNDVLGHLTAMSFMRPETSEDLEKPLNVLSEAISEFENLDIHIVVGQSEQLACNRINDMNANRCINCGAKAGHPCERTS
tara:strand:- start:102 stop:362 length:261 start_codon:yes stop_codon:yes gene_type:complete